MRAATERQSRKLSDSAGEKLKRSDAFAARFTAVSAAELNRANRFVQKESNSKGSF